MKACLINWHQSHTIGRAQIRWQFRFADAIYVEAMGIIKRAFSEWSVNQRRAVLVGTHIRRGDYLVAMKRIGLREPPPDYYRAVSSLISQLCGEQLNVFSQLYLYRYIRI